ncbi:sensor domain-containing diguanylate cyclase [Luteimonas sp. SX5]|uniref:diguanylate cyclase n=1 Tax=Luteimonas galliterrae TaxID=2940486 RepID=A0ABT0MJA6_9GAMM|nr:sensor domain-containing diguanylate cyclase [Luteimonas galliterrae]MCL1634693.1 sensor domain-containing diguanylate cyclase [Luteimonas galliterrae]
MNSLARQFAVDLEVDVRESERLAILDSYAILDSEGEQAFDDIVQLACAICETPVASITLIDHDRQWFKASVGFGVRETPREEAVCDVAIRTPERLLEIPDLQDDARTPMRPTDAAGIALRFYAGMPLVSPEGHALGTVCVLDHAPRSLTEAQRRALGALGRQVQHLLELRRYVLQQGSILQQRLAEAERLESARADLQRRHDDMKRAATYDALTGLLNRTALEQLRQRPDAMLRLEAATYSLAVVDIDHFKQVNDRYGHLIGDEVLRAVAEVIAASIRQDDIAVRYGGEEFLLVLLATPLASAYEVAERIRQSVMEAPLPFPVTVSVGIAAATPPRDTPEKVFELADQALYRAKAGGRNRVVADDTQRF